MHVIKRNGEKELVCKCGHIIFLCLLLHYQVHFDKITLRIRRLCEQEPPLPPEVEPVLVSQKVVQGVFSGVKTTELDNLAAETAAYLSTTHPGNVIFNYSYFEIPKFCC